MNLQISRKELELIHQALRVMPRGPGSQELTTRIHSLKSDYDTEQKTLIDPFRERFPECKAPDWTIRMGFEHDEDCGWCDMGQKDDPRDTELLGGKEY